MIRIAALTIAIALSLSAQTVGAHASDGMEVVYCHDTTRDLVQRVRLRHCNGRIVTPQQAGEIHTRIEAERLSRRQRTLTQTQAREQGGFRFKSAGAAFAVNQQGELLTSAHVVRGCDALEARNNDSLTPYPASIKAVAEGTDLAVIKINAATPDILRFSAESPADGSPLALIGYPIEGMIRRIPRLTPVLTSHAISHPSKYGLIGVAGDVRRGNSGGPALDSRGRAVGVLKAKINTVAAHQLTGRVLTNLGVVVETTRVLQFLRESQTPFAIDRATATEKSGRTLYEQGSRAVFRVDCLVRG